MGSWCGCWCCDLDGVRDDPLRVSVLTNYERWGQLIAKAVLIRPRTPVSLPFHETNRNTLQAQIAALMRPRERNQK